MHASAPLVSVVIPAYNAARTLRAAVTSVLSQTYRPLEVLVVDDGSTDDTPRLAAALGPPVRFFRQENQGVSVARNTAIHCVQEGLIAFLDADDEWMPQKLEKQVAFLTRNAEVGLVYTQVLRIDPQGRVRGVAPKKGGEDRYADLYRSNRIPTSTVVARKEVLDRTGDFDPALKITQDYDLWLRIAARYRFAGLRQPLARYHDHGMGLYSNVRLRYEEHLTILDRAPLRPSEGVDEVARERARAHYLYRLGRLAVRDRRWGNAASYFARVLERPSRYGTRRRGPADQRVRYFRALRWYLVSRTRASRQNRHALLTHGSGRRGD